MLRWRKVNTQIFELRIQVFFSILVQFLTKSTIRVSLKDIDKFMSIRNTGETTIFSILKSKYLLLFAFVLMLAAQLVINESQIERYCANPCERRSYT